MQREIEALRELGAKRLGGDGVLSSPLTAWCYHCGGLVTCAGGMGRPWQCPRCRNVPGSRPPARPGRRVS